VRPVRAHLRRRAWAGYKGQAAQTVYNCNGKMQGRGLYGLRGLRCPNRSLNGVIEEWVWRDMEAWLRDPGPILAEVAA
jgi:hypothetical protein